MQKDMHYTGTYCLARAAGLTSNAAQVIASAAQYVDDNVETRTIDFKDGARLQCSATAHHYADLVENNQPDDQRNVWVPFHFLPGGEAAEDGDADYTERLKCRMDSEPARMMVETVISEAALSPLVLERVGITAHVYADTFSHYGFSGVSSRRNRVHGSSFIFHNVTPEEEGLLKNVAEAFFEKHGEYGGLLNNIKSWLAQELSGALGHGAVATFPDFPYLDWEFTYEMENQTSGRRNNQETFLLACRSLYGFFQEIAKARPEHAGPGGRSFEQIEETIRDILAVVGDSSARSRSWDAAARAGQLFAGAESIPEYLGEKWTSWLQEEDDRGLSDVALQHSACRFHLAAHAHRSWVQHTLMPSRNLLIA